MMKNNRVIVVGGGAAGLMAAGTAGFYGADVLLLEKNKRVGRKIVITGKGRCNVTNNCSVEDFISNVPTNPRFLFSALNAFTPQDTIDFFEQNGVLLKTERGNRVFPVSDKSLDIVDCLSRFTDSDNIRKINCTVKSLIFDNDRVVGVIDNNGDKYLADSVIVACGGLSYPLTGSTGDGYKLARQAGHTVTKLTPSLVALESDDEICTHLQGLSLKNISVKAVDKTTGKTVFSDFGEMLFTHFGVSGPVILSLSSHLRDIKKDRYKILIDLKPALTCEQLDLRIQRDFQSNINKAVINSFDKLLPKKLIPQVISLWNIDPYTKCNSVTKVKRAELVAILKNLEINIDRTRPIEEAIITSGGVSVKEINPKTMESKLIKGLYFAGEVIDVDAYTGGFNLQIAFSTGRLSGESAAFAN